MLVPTALSIKDKAMVEDLVMEEDLVTVIED